MASLREYFDTGVTMHVVARNNVVVKGSGDGPPLIFAHGFGCDQTMWRHVASAFETDHRIVLFYHVGVGRSDLLAYDPDRYDRLRGCADDVVQIADTLDLSVAVLVGHSVDRWTACVRSIVLRT